MLNPADTYREKAEEFDAAAREEKDPAISIEWVIMAKGYRRLAELAERNALNDVVYEPAIAAVVQRQQHQNQPQQQQQEQPQPASESDQDKP